MKKRRIQWSLLLSLVFVFALGVAGASATDVTWNPNDKSTAVVLSNNNLTARGSEGVKATEGKSTGKWYFEVRVDSQDYIFIGFSNSNTSVNSWNQPDHNVFYYTNRGMTPYKYFPETAVTGAPLTTVGQWLGIGLDMDNGTVSFFPNGENLSITNPANITIKSIASRGDGKLYPKVYFNCNDGIVTANFGATPFAYGVPTGYQPYNGSQPTVQDPTNLTATAGDAQVSLSWTEVTGATSYKIKRTTTVGGPYTEVAANITGTTHTDSDLTNGTTYYYVVTAVTASGESGNSNEASATPQQGTTPPPATGNGMLIVTVANNADREYNLTMAQIQAFIDWYNNRSSGGNVYIIEKTATSPYTRVKDYLIFDKIVAWQVKEY